MKKGLLMIEWAAQRWEGEALDKEIQIQLAKVGFNFGVEL